MGPADQRPEGSSSSWRSPRRRPATSRDRSRRASSTPQRSPFARILRPASTAPLTCPFAGTGRHNYSRGFAVLWFYGLLLLQKNISPTPPARASSRATSPGRAVVGAAYCCLHGIESQSATCWPAGRGWAARTRGRSVRRSEGWSASVLAAWCARSVGTAARSRRAAPSPHVGCAACRCQRRRA